jgi:hypothetical protein
MSPQDEHKLTDFLTQLIQARGIQKDQEADALIQRAVAQQPDAAYLLVQRALLLEQGMNNARTQIASLQNQLRSLQQDGQPGQQGDGRYPDANTWGNSGNARPVPPPVQQYQPNNQQPYQPPYQPSYQSAPGPMGMGAPGGFFGGGGGLRGTLGSIATTAAGVAAGSFLFQGLENMFSHHEGGGNHLLNSDDPANNLFNDQSGSGLANQAGLGDVDGSIGQPAEGLFDNSADTSSLDDGGGQGFFDGDGSDDGLFS